MNEELEKILNSNKEELLTSIKKVVKIPSVRSEPEEKAPFGNEVNKALNYTLKLAEDMGFETDRVDGYAGHIQFGNKGKLFGVLGHLDVVPAGDGWSVDPFDGTIKEGYIYGRGVIDDKGPTIASIYALKAIKELGVDPKNKIRIILGTNEESGWGGITEYFKHEEKPQMAVTPDAAFPLIYAEKGIVNYEISTECANSKEGIKIKELSGGNASNMVPSKAKAVLEGVDDRAVEIIKNYTPENKAKLTVEENNSELVINVEGVSAHGSTPDRGENAIVPLLKVLSKLEINNVELEAFIKKLSQRIGYETDGKSLGISGSDDMSGVLTLNLGTLELRENLIKAVINIRYPVFFNESRIQLQLKEALKGLKVVAGHHLEPHYVSPDSELVKLLTEVYEKVTGKKAELLTTGGGTYARAVTNAVAFGALFPGREETEHKPDERILIDDLMLLTKIYATLFYKILTEW
ncbi:MAG: dipeptidase PepV [Thermotogota bacterium]|nr:dipeptidase PepV [Thermotogota bacterium]